MKDNFSDFCKIQINTLVNVFSQPWHNAKAMCV